VRCILALQLRCLPSDVDAMNARDVVTLHALLVGEA
jgi:hypothetical protein